MSGEELLDLRGEPCGMPLVRVEKHLLASGGQPFLVWGDELATLEALQVVALRRRWACDVLWQEGFDWRARFRPDTP